MARPTSTATAHWAKTFVEERAARITSLFPSPATDWRGAATGQRFANFAVGSVAKPYHSRLQLHPSSCLSAYKMPPQLERTSVWNLASWRGLRPSLKVILCSRRYSTYTILKRARHWEDQSRQIAINSPCDPCVRSGTRSHRTEHHPGKSPINEPRIWICVPYSQTPIPKPDFTLITHSLTGLSGEDTGEQPQYWSFRQIM